jgi:hypothetical protein
MQTITMSATPAEAAPARVDATAGGDRAWVASLLGLDPAASAGLAAEARRLGVALVMSAGYGVALGLRGGARAMALEALAIPSAWLAIALLGVPALAILLALADAPLQAPDLLRAAARAAARGGLVLSGLAAPMALLTTTTEEAGSAVAFGALGLAVAWGFALRAFSLELTARAGSGRATLAVIGFALFATTLAARIWLAALAPLWGAS